jgi:hypothetical protein
VRVWVIEVKRARMGCGRAPDASSALTVSGCAVAGGAFSLSVDPGEAAVAWLEMFSGCVVESGCDCNSGGEVYGCANDGWDEVGIGKSLCAIYYFIRLC